MAERREAQRALATEVTELVHGRAATDAVIAASEALFGQGDLATLDAASASTPAYPYWHQVATANDRFGAADHAAFGSHLAG